MKKKALLTCKGMLPANVVETLSRYLDIRIASCALSEIGLIKEIYGINFHFMGGEEFYTFRAAQAAKSLEKIFFIGIMPDTYRSSEAYDYFKGKGIEIIPTGGGQSAVVQSTLDIFHDDLLTVPLFSRRFKWVANEPGGLKNILKKINLVVVGAGKIGLEILSQSHGEFGASFYGGGRSPKKVLDDLGINWKKDLKEAFSLGDIVSVNLAYGPETHHMVRYEHLSEMPKDSLLINSSRATVIEPIGFLEFIKRRSDVSVILDVFYVEGEDYERIGETSLGTAAMYREMIQSPNVHFLQHQMASRHPELAIPEYGENLLRKLREQNIIP